MSANRPLWFGILAYSLVLGAMLGLGLHDTHGHFAYPLDDAYIHMAIARTLAEHGVWGIDRSTFVSASSSPLWTLLLAIWFKLGGGQIGPLVINMPFAFGTLVVSDHFLKSHAASERARCLTSVALALVTPLPLLTLMGMEHSLQTLVFILFLVCASDYFETKEKWLPTLGLLGLLTAVRPEGLFAAAIFGMILLVRRSVLQGMIAGLVALAPLSLFAAYSWWHGAYPIPNSILLKAGLAQPAAETLFHPLLEALPKALGTGLIAVGMIVAIARLRLGPRDSGWHFAVLWLGTALLHLLLAPFGWLFRYEAYLVASGIVLIGANGRLILEVHERLKAKRVLRAVTYIVMALGIGETLSRAAGANLVGALAIRDRYYENVQSAEFVKRYYDDDGVMVNDIGAFAFFTNAKVLDLFGLGSNEPIRFQRSEDGYDYRDVQRWAEESDPKIAIIKVEWLYMRALVPPDWKPVVTWHLPRNVIFADDRLTFFARDPATAEELERNMRNFAANMPAAIRVEFHE